MKRLIIALFTFVLAMESKALNTPQLHQISYGKTESPITIIEYTSLTCHHCADFHLKVLPKIKEKYISTGHLRLIIRPFPQDKDAVTAFKLVHSLPEDRQDMAMTKMYSSQTHWIGKSPEVVGRVIGLSPEQCKTAIEDKDTENTLLASVYKASKEHQVEATPTFFVDGMKIEGAPTFEEFDRSIQELQATKDSPHPAGGLTRWN